MRSRTRRLRPILCLLGCLPAVAAGASEYCLFETECFEAEACQRAEWSLGLHGDVVSTDFGDLDVVARSGGVLVAAAPGMTVVIGRGEGVDARASVHLEGPVVVSYLGTCQEAF